MNLRTCVTSSGIFAYGIHKPAFCAKNFREQDSKACLGRFEDGTLCENYINFPPDEVQENSADPIYEIPNAFPFRGTTFIIKSAADKNAKNPSAIGLASKPELSMSNVMRQWSETELSKDQLNKFFKNLPEPMALAIASNSSDPEDLTFIADFCCEFVRDPETGRPTGLVYNNQNKPKIKNHVLFEVLANNIFLPDDYKQVMVLRPGVQGSSEIVGEWIKSDDKSHIFEYLRRNSYIPWGHYAANMADDSIRYKTNNLTMTDMTGMRHLYYQRTYARLAQNLGISIPQSRKTLSVDELEKLREKICRLILSDKPDLKFNCSLWGWNFGFDYAPSHYRLHASHQQIHQQYALIPSYFSHQNSDEISSFAFGDLAADFIEIYKHKTNKNFFDNYIKAIKNNTRTDKDKTRASSLVVYEDENVILFVPKAQTSQWELQLMTIGKVGNILEADTCVRASLDKAMLYAVQTLENMGAKMITNIECSKRFDSSDTDQRLLYCFLPKMPYSPGSFTEAQLRWINGHYPEDFAIACRRNLKTT